MLGDTGLAVHPSDHRYSHLIGQTVKNPLTNQLMPIIADSSVDPDFGTGHTKFYNLSLTLHINFLRKFHSQLFKQYVS